MDVSPYSKLEHLIKRKDVRFVSLLSGARSSSTAILNCLVASPSVVTSCYEIFRSSTDRYTPWDILLKYALNTDSQRKENIIIIKDLAKNINPNAWERFDSLISAHIFLIRNPILQLSSLLKIYQETILSHEYTLKRYLNDTLYDRFSLDSIKHQFKLSKSEYENMLKFRREGWNWLNVEYNSTSKAYIYDASIIRAYPEMMFKEICSDIGIKFTSSILGNWSFNLRKVNTGEITPYTSRVSYSNRLEFPYELPVTLNCFPDLYKEYIKYAFQIYLGLLGKRRTLHTFPAISEIFKGGNKCLKEIDPICYGCFIKSSESISGKDKIQYIHQLMQEYPKYSDYFQLILSK